SHMHCVLSCSSLFSSVHPLPTQFYTLSLHDALPIYKIQDIGDRAVSAYAETKVPQHIAIILDGNGRWAKQRRMPRGYGHIIGCQDRKSTRLNSSHVSISYAVFCLKKKKTQ